MDPIPSLLIDGRPEKMDVFAVPELSLSSGRAECIRHSFVLTLAAEEVVALLEPAYADWVSESKKDDELCGGPQDELAMAGYPALRQLLDHPELLMLVVGGYLLESLLSKLAWNGSSPIDYWLDEVTDCSLDGHLVRLSGVCYGRMIA